MQWDTLTLFDFAFLLFDGNHWPVCRNQWEWTSVLWIPYVHLCPSGASWHPVAREQPSRPEPARHLCGLAVGSEPLVRVINLLNGPIRRQFSRLMTARCGESEPDSPVAFMKGDERKRVQAQPRVSECWKSCKHFHSSIDLSLPCFWCIPLRISWTLYRRIKEKLETSNMSPNWSQSA